MKMKRQPPAILVCILALLAVVSASAFTVDGDGGGSTHRKVGRNLASEEEEYVMLSSDIKWVNSTEAWQEYLAFFPEDEVDLKNGPPSNVQIVEVNRELGIVRAVVDGEYLLTARGEGLFDSEYALEACDQVVAGRRLVVSDVTDNSRIEVKQTQGCRSAVATGDTSAIQAVATVNSRNVEVECTDSLCLAVSGEMTPIRRSTGPGPISNRNNQLRHLNGWTVYRSGRFSIQLFKWGVKFVWQLWTCFPGKATVMTENKGPIPISQLAIGDRVQSIADDGRLMFSEVYLQGHADSKAFGMFIQLETLGGQTLHLSPDHYIPVKPAMPAEGTAGFVLKPARLVAPGDHLLVAEAKLGKEAVMSQVSNVARVVEQGLFNPYTLNSRIVVDGVVASSHSGWFMEDVVPSKYAHHIPRVYDFLLSPVRMLYRHRPTAVARWHAQHGDVFNIFHDVWGMLKASVQVAVST